MTHPTTSGGNDLAETLLNLVDQHVTEHEILARFPQQTDEVKALLKTLRKLKLFSATLTPPQALLERTLAALPIKVKAPARLQQLGALRYFAALGLAAAAVVIAALIITWPKTSPSGELSSSPEPATALSTNEAATQAAAPGDQTAPDEVIDEMLNNAEFEIAGLEEETQTTDPLTDDDEALNQLDGAYDPTQF